MTSVLRPERGRDSKSGGAPKPEDLVITPGVIGTKIHQSFATGGEIAQFSARTIRGLPDVRHFVGEVLRQAATLILSSGLIIWAMQFVMGSVCATEASYTLKQIGAPLYSGIFNVYCGFREMSPYMWGYILAAKVGCGLVAEIGSMRITDEIDAMEVMGINSRTYLVGTRILATWMAMPFLYTIGLGMLFISEYLVTVLQLRVVSPGGYNYIFWLYQNPVDFLMVLAKVMTMGTVIIFVSCYYGYNSRGGPVGVGTNTAKSMMVNMVMIHIVSTLFTQLFWGLNPNAPIAN
ncbi:ABC transporter permease [Streptomyces sp. NPDC005202]|uniref:ABC transporter permease n=1 Tax=Streptomyces sp. NPDC005202 TaxID=3157021 RepID=UPI0033A08841